MIAASGRSRLSKSLGIWMHPFTRGTPHLSLCNGNTELRQYGSTRVLGSAHEGNFRQTKLRADVFHRLKPFYSRKNSRLTSSATSDIENVIRNNKVRRRNFSAVIYPRNKCDVHCCIKFSSSDALFSFLNRLLYSRNHFALSATKRRSCSMEWT